MESANAVTEQMGSMNLNDAHVKACIDKGNNLRVSTGFPDVQAHPPTDVLCVIDVSKSMGDSCNAINDGSTQYVELAYSLLDLVKHAVKTVANVLGDNDRLSVVVFTYYAKVHFDFMDMHEVGK